MTKFRSVLRRYVLIGAAGLAAIAGLLFVGTPSSTAAPPPMVAEKAVLGTLDDAREVLGRPVPLLNYSMPGLTLNGVGIGPARPGSRQVHISYALIGKSVVLMTLQSGQLETDEGADFPLPGAVAKRIVRDIDGGSSRDAQYAWSRDGLAYVLHINLSGAISEDVADEMARSIK